MSATIICKYKHGDCLAAAFQHPDDPDFTIRCTALENCDFVGRTDCPFYKTAAGTVGLQKKKDKEGWE